MNRLYRTARHIAIVAHLVSACLVYNSTASAKELLLTADDIRIIAPKAKSEFVQALLDARGEFEAAEINTRLRMAHFLSQVLTETGGLKRIDENMNYSYKALMRVFSRRTVSEADARRIAGKPREVANWVYGARLGNRGRNTNDGWDFRGSGFIQLTGRDNFTRRGADIGLPLADNPEMVRQAKEGLTAAIAYWQATGINAAADANDRMKVRKLVNGPAAAGTIYNVAVRETEPGFIGTPGQISSPGGITTNTGLDGNQGVESALADFDAQIQALFPFHAKFCIARLKIGL